MLNISSCASNMRKSSGFASSTTVIKVEEVKLNIPQKMFVKLISGDILSGRLKSFDTVQKEIVIEAGSITTSIAFSDISILFFEEISLPRNNDNAVIRGLDTWQIKPANSFKLNNEDPTILSIEVSSISTKNQTTPLLTEKNYLLSSLKFGPLSQYLVIEVYPKQ
ncbi:hypothetical protein [Sphaerothrix gracilis]|uniref:hypothetical protein n=1 Tax=Sphaerothrix gracilis TaxID=3151835 RepID=UPI0031FC8C06